MKKYTTRVIVTLFLFMLSFYATSLIYASASETSDSVIDHLITEKKEECSRYITEIEEAMQILDHIESGTNNADTMILQSSSDTIATYDTSNAYKVYILEPLFLTILDNTGCFDDAITEVIQWKVPFTTEEGESGLATLLEDTGKLSFIGMTVGEATNVWSVNNNDIKNAVENAQDFDIDTNSLKIAHSYLYNTTFVYLSGGETNYLIPFSIYSDEIGIENGKLYTVSELQNYFIKCFDESILLDSPSSNSGVPFRNRSVISLELLICGIFILCSIVVVSVMYSFKKSKYTK